MAISIAATGSGICCPAMLSDASAWNELSMGDGPPPTLNPAPLLMSLKLIDKVREFETICGWSEPPVTVAKDVVNRAPVAGGPIGPVNALFAKVPESSKTLAGL